MFASPNSSRLTIACRSVGVMGKRFAWSGSVWWTAVPVMSASTTPRFSRRENTFAHSMHGFKPLDPLHPRMQCNANSSAIHPPACGDNACVHIQCSLV